MNLFLMLSIPILLIGCHNIDLTANHDAEIKFTRIEYEKALSKNAISKEQQISDAPAIPRLSKIVAIPANPNLNEEKLISVSANEDIPIVDLLLEIGRIAAVDIVIDKRIIGETFIEMKNRPLFEVLDRISEVADLRYSQQNGTIIFEYDDPYVATYNINFLNITRTNSSSMHVNTSVLSGNMNSGSSSSLSSSTDDTFWADMTQNVNQIVNSSLSISNKKRFSKINQTQNGNSTNSGGTNNNTSTPSQVANQGSTNSPSQSSGQNSGSSLSGSGNISLSKSSGMISVFANSKGHLKIKEYLEDLKMKVSAQVLIEVKLAEVVLNKNFQTGIDLSFFGNVGSNGTVKLKTNSLSQITNPAFSASGGSTTQSMTAAVNLLDSFGTTRILSSPRVVAINNQQAILTFADNQVFFDISVSTTAPQTSTATGAVQNTVVPSILTVTSSPKTIPVGVVLVLQPSIDLEKGTIMLNIRPTVSRIKESKEDPGFNYITKTAGVTDVPANMIPVTSIREMDVVLNMKSEDIMLMGGFTERYTDIKEIGIPIISRIPLLGWFFTKRIEVYETKEIVLLIKATIVNEKTDIQEYDRYFYKTFFNDPRELNF